MDAYSYWLPLKAGSNMFTTSLQDIVQSEVSRLSITGGNASTTEYPDHLTTFRRYEFNPLGFVTQELGFQVLTDEMLIRYAGVGIPDGMKVITQQQAEVIAAVGKYPKVAVPSGHGSGKCRSKDDFVTLWGGSHVELGNLVGKVVKLPDLLPSGDIVPRTALVSWNIVEDVYDITLDNGMELGCSGNHPLYSRKRASIDAQSQPLAGIGFKPITALRVGDLVAVADVLPVFGKREYSDARVVLTAYMIGDGVMTHSSLMFSQSENEVLNEFMAYCYQVGVKVKYVAKYDYSVSSEDVGTSNILRDWLGESKLTGKHSSDKRIPAEFWELPKCSLKLFVNRLYSIKGLVYARKYKAGSGQRCSGELRYVSASKGLVRDLQILLQRFGVHARISYKPKTTSWSLTIADAGEIRKFFTEFGYIHGRHEQCKELLNVATDNIIKVRDANHKQQADHVLVAYRNTKAGTRWERITSITKRPVPERTVAISVPCSGTYLTEVYEHNTMLACFIAMWFSYCRVPSQVITTAPTWKHVEKAFWTQFRNIHRTLPKPRFFGKLIKTDLTIADGWFCTGYNAENPSAVQGFHSPNVMVIFDEATGINKPFWPSFRSLMMSENDRFLAIGNPTDPTAEFKRACDSDEWYTVQLNCEEHPNVTEDTIYIQGAVTQSYIDDVLADCNGLRSASLYKSRVLGEFPDETSSVLFPTSIYNVATSNYSAESTISGFVDAAGLDLSRHNDECVLMALTKDANNIYHAKAWTWTSTSTLESVDALKQMYLRNRRIRIGIDYIGMGTAISDVMERDRIPHTQCTGSKSATNPTQYSNMRSEMYWQLRLDLASGIVQLDPNDGVLREQLLRQITVYEPSGKIKLEPKDKLRQRIGQSVDRADALVMANWVRMNRDVAALGEMPLVASRPKGRLHGMQSNSGLRSGRRVISDRLPPRIVANLRRIRDGS